MSRWGQSLSRSDELRMSIYADDPILVVKGRRESRNSSICKVLLVWLAVGFKLAWHKGQRDATITWTSGLMKIEAKSVSASIKQEIVDAVWNDTIRFLNSNVVAITELLPSQFACKNDFQSFRSF